MKQISNSFRILALETSTERCSVAVASTSGVCSAGEIVGQKHSELLLPMIDSLMRQAGVKMMELDAVAFGAGPGSFTGLRIGCGVAQGLAFAVGCKVVPIGTMEAVAEACAEDRVVVCIDARMEQVYLGAFVRESGAWRTVLAPQLCDPEHVPLLPAGQWVGCGNGFERYPLIGSSAYANILTAVSPEAMPDAREIATLAAQSLAAGGGVDSEAVAPVYVRNKVALTQAEQS